MKHYIGIMDDIHIKQQFRATIKVGHGIANMLYKDGKLHTGMLDTQATDGVYKVETFEGVLDGISTCFGYRISAETQTGPVFLTSNLDDRVGTYDDIHTDERCFIESEFGAKTTLRSLIHKEYFISYNKGTNSFVMKKIPKKQYRAFISGLSSINWADRETEDYLSAEHKLDDCWFYFSKSPVVSPKSRSISGRFAPTSRSISGRFAPTSRSISGRFAPRSRSISGRFAPRSRFASRSLRSSRRSPTNCSIPGRFDATFVSPPNR